MNDRSNNDASEAEQAVLKRFRRAVNETYDILARMGIGDREGLDELGAIEMAHRHLKNSTISEGFSRLWEMGRLEISVEAIVLRPEFKELFSEQERRIAEERLAQKGYGGGN